MPCRAGAGNDSLPGAVCTQASAGGRRRPGPRRRLGAPRTAGDDRGLDDAPLLLLNHWVSPPSPELATEANSEEVLLARAERCSELRGQPVNLVAVDFYENGDLLATVDELNRRRSPDG